LHPAQNGKPGNPEHDNPVTKLSAALLFLVRFAAYLPVNAARLTLPVLLQKEH
jgi:hypothetical protein